MLTHPSPLHPAGDDGHRLDVLAIAGSLRRDSHNRRLLEVARRVAPATMTITIYEELAAVPLFNEDLEGDEPRGVAALRRTVRTADGVLIATPEYNQSVPGVLKNAIDWLSRSDGGLTGVPVAVVGATTGPWGTRLAQAELRHVLNATGAHVLGQPALYVAHAASALTAAGDRSDGVARRLGELLASFSAWIRAARAHRHGDPAPSPAATSPVPPAGALAR